MSAEIFSDEKSTPRLNLNPAFPTKPIVPSVETFAKIEPSLLAKSRFISLSILKKILKSIRYFLKTGCCSSSIPPSDTSPLVGTISFPFKSIYFKEQTFPSTIPFSERSVGVKPKTFIHFESKISTKSSTLEKFNLYNPFRTLTSPGFVLSSEP